MFYHYKFFEKANLQPDLKEDVCVYLIKPLQVLYLLEQKIKELSVSKKTKSYNMDIGYEIEDIVNSKLPSIIDEYCNFPLEYRNKEVITSAIGKAGTLKEILLETLNNVFNHIDELQKKFYQENEVNFLATNAYFENFQKTSKVEVLENKFDLKAFQDAMFKNLLKENEKSHLEVYTPEPQKINLTKTEEQEEQVSTGTLTLVELLLVLVFISMAIVAVFITYPIAKSNMMTAREYQNDIEHVAAIKNNYNVQKDGKFTNLKSIIPNYTELNPWGGSSTLTPVSVNNVENSGIKLVETELDNNVCKKFIKMFELGQNDLQSISINENELTTVTDNNIVNLCNHESNTLKLIFKK